MFKPNIAKEQQIEIMTFTEAFKFNNKSLKELHKRLSKTEKELFGRSSRSATKIKELPTKGLNCFYKINAI